MRVQLLGPVAVFDGDGGPVDVGGPKQRTVLATLCLDPGSAVSTDALAEAVWGDDVPDRANRSLATFVSNLRGALGDRLGRDGPGYVARLDRSAVDACVFQDLVARARDQLDTDPTSALETAERALNMWQGEPLAGLDGHGMLAPAVTQLSDLRVTALEILLGAKVDTGRHGEAITELQHQVEEHPHHEHLRALLMRALYAAGRQTEALATYREFAAALADDFGLDPSPELQSLEVRILQQDPTLSVSPPTRREPPQQVVGTALPADAGDRPAPRPPRSPEQRLVTVVMAAIGGTEELKDAAGAIDPTRILSEIEFGIVAALESLGGTVVSRSIDRVAATFGAPVAREDDSYRAIRAALMLNDAVAETRAAITRSWGVAVDVRAAVHTALMTIPISSAPALDEPMQVLRAMLTAAAPSTVLVDDHTRTLMGDLFFWEAEPIAVGDDDLAWLARTVLGDPDKARMGRRLRAPLTGRRAEMAAAMRSIDALRRGVGGILFVSGEAGVGKSRLVAEVLDAAGAGGEVLRLVGHCVSHAEATPYWPFRDLFRSWLELGIDDTDLKARVALHHRLDSDLPDEAGTIYPYLGSLLGIALEPEAERRLDVSSEALQYRTFEVVAQVFEELATRTPLVVVIEDAHWADPTSVQLLEQLLPIAARGALLLVLTTRIDPDHPSWRLAEVARRRSPHLTNEVVLGTLHDDAQQAMLDALVGAGTLPAATARAVLRLAEGNPFYLEELVGSLVDEGALVATDEGWGYDHDVDVVVPETIEKVVQARIDRLDGPAHDLVTAAAVLGRSFGLGLLGAVLDAESVSGAIDDLLRLDLLVEARRLPQPEYVFKHALIQEAAYRTIPRERRIGLHRRAALWLERRYQGNEDEVAGALARHWAVAGDDDKAIGALVRAGDLARRDHALDEAIDHYRSLLPILERRDDKETMALVLFKLALALHTSLRFAESNDVYQRAFALWEPHPGPPPTATLRYASSQLVDPGDPIRSYYLSDIQLQMALFDRLVERIQDDTLVPSLAERWQISDDGLRYRFVLREGLVWSDGHPLLADDAAFGVLRNLDPDDPGISVAMFYVIAGAQDRAEGKEIDLDDIGVAVIDDRTVEFRLFAPAPYFLAMLNRPDAGPQPRHAVEKHGDDWALPEYEVVSGAFRRLSHAENEVVLERRADYQGTRSGNVQTVEWRPLPFGEAVDIAARGSADLMWLSGSWDGVGVERIPEDRFHLEPPAGLLYVACDHRRHVSSSLALRLALAHAIDRNALEQSLPKHAYPAAGGIVPPALAGHTPDIAPRFDPVRARRLLEESGVTDPIRLAILATDESMLPSLGRRLAAMWREHLGCEVEEIEMDGLAYADLREGNSAGIDAFLQMWFPGYTDPEYFLRLLLHSDAADNVSHFSDPRFDDLVERARRERDERTRLALFHEADRLAVAEQVAMIPLAYTRNVSMVSPGIEGWWEFGKSWANFADLTVR